MIHRPTHIFSDERCKLARKIQKMKKGGKRWVKEKKPRKVTVYRDILSEQK